MPTARLLPAAYLLLAVLVLGGGTGCIGAVAGTIIDTTQDVLRYPVQEYVFQAAFKYDNDPDAPWQQLEDDVDRDYGDELVGVAVSGGGSRAAYFTACVLDEMRRLRAGDGRSTRSLLDEVDYVSSVSGGSLASAYYVLERPPGSEAAELDAFFARYRRDMKLHFELRSLARTMFLLRWLPLVFTYYHRGHIMASTWDANFFDDATFADLPEAAPPYPSLVINATSYSSGHKFLFTRLPSARFNESRVFENLRRGRLNTLGYDAGHQPLHNIGFDSIDSDIGAFPISLAVVASAGVPNLLGPVIVRDRTAEAEAYEALGDGGIYDNYGLETLVQLFTRILDERPGTRARIVVIDGSGFVPAEPQVTDYSVAGYSDRTTTIAWLRAADYAEPIYGALGGLGEDRPYRNLRIQLVSLYGEGVEKGEEREGLPDIVKGAVKAVADPVLGFFDVLNESVRGIGTRFKLSDDDAEAIETQARVIVPAALGDGDRAPRPPR